MIRLGDIIDTIIDLTDDIDPYRGMSYEEEFMDITKQIIEEGCDDAIAYLKQYLTESSEDARDVDVIRWCLQFAQIKKMVDAYMR